MTKMNELLNWFKNKQKVMVALSGGVDSALVAYAAFQELGTSAIAVTADYKTLSTEELDTAKKVCMEIGIRQIFLDYDELKNKDFAKNDSDRCFHCRDELGSRLVEMAKDLNISVIVDGTNIDDLGEFRPGIDAMKKYGIRSPLIDTHFTKSQIRNSAKSVGLSVYDKPSNSCLASRIPWGNRITSEKLIRIEIGEKIVKQIVNARQIRVRDLGGNAKIEVETEMVSIFTKEIMAQITEKFKIIGFSSVELDHEGYKPGKINVIAD